LIAELDPEDYELQLQDAAASLAQAQAQERNAAASYERVRGLYESRNASKQDLDAARAQYESAVASVQSIDRKLDLARNQLSYTRLTAPIAASVASVGVEVNENVSAGQTVVLLTSGSQMKVRVTIPELLISQIREGDVVTVKFDALRGTKIAGRVTEVGVAATGAGSTYPATVLLDPSDADVRSGMAAEVAFQFETSGRAERIIVPLVSVGEDREGRFVFVVEPTGTPGVAVVHRRNVSTGEFAGAGVEVLDGLVDGEYVVTAGVSRLIDGQEVKFTAPGEGQ
jgi:RND family efflux transporter MFP subunit